MKQVPGPGGECECARMLFRSLQLPSRRGRLGKDVRADRGDGKKKERICSVVPLRDSGRTTGIDEIPKDPQEKAAAAPRGTRRQPGPAGNVIKGVGTNARGHTGAHRRIMKTVAWKEEDRQNSKKSTHRGITAGIADAAFVDWQLDVNACGPAGLAAWTTRRKRTGRTL